MSPTLSRLNSASHTNQFLPEKLPLRLLSGQARLSADIQLEPESAGGYVNLQTDGLQTEVDEQQLSGELTLNVNLRGGIPSKMDFDISGSNVRLDDVRVTGEQANFDQAGWAAGLDLSKGRVVWKKPVRLDLEANIAMHDTRPIVALLANQRGKHGWVEKLLTLEGVQGTARLAASADRVLIPYAFAGSDKIDVGAKGLVDADTREGVFYTRFRKLHGILKVKDGERNFDVIGATAKFETYSPGETNLGLGQADGERQGEKAGTGG